MPAATLTSKGQITIPLAVRTALGLHAGIKVDFVRLGDGFKVVPLRNAASSLKGRFAGRVGKPVRIEVMDQAIAAKVTRRVTRNKR
ncbi:MAG: AbrB/MazE/SpoVT family DNA-binding domain-containing protein [Rhodoferax sp.]|nr:AbrB/MazE/SpoVT family DNA-binding domain-containing protein [Rhodoferax sp.]